jgi:hypothetical protein
MEYSGKHMRKAYTLSFPYRLRDSTKMPKDFTSREMFNKFEWEALRSECRRMSVNGEF